MFLFFVGCEGGPGGGGGESDTPQSLDGVKVLSKPADYSFGDAVGEYATEYYYNLFSGAVLKTLYNVYENGTLDELKSNTKIATEIEDLENGKEYLYDSLRYTIDQVVTTRDKTSDKIIKQQLTLDINSAWDWSFGYNQAGISNDGKETGPIVFILNPLSGGIDWNDLQQTNDSVIINFNKILFERNILKNNWTELYNVPGVQLTDFQKIYAPITTESSSTVTKPDGSSVEKYNDSPYIQAYVSKENPNENEIALNYYQDALEYAVYLFVLGYDYVDTDGNPTADAPLFDFSIDFSKLTTADRANAVKVGGWENQPISIVEALSRVKAIYAELGGYVGVTDKNKQQIKRFVLDKIIGKDALNKDTVSVKRVNQLFTPSADGSGTGGTETDPNRVEDPLVFKRHYEKIVGAVVDYSCSQASIGWDAGANNGTGGSISLDDAYLASQITDYKGDYFFASYENNSDQELYKYIEAAEYQSMILYPLDDFLGKQLTDLIISFEYFENPVAGLKMKDSITINVGFRYFSASANGGAGGIVDSGEVQKEIKFGKGDDIPNENPDVNWVYIGNSDKEQSQYDIGISSDVVVNGKFNGNIGNGAINPFAGDSSVNEKKSKLISGTDDARKFYKLNDSSSYGVFGTLNEAKFSVNAAGEQACDFIEVYFDTVKEKGVLGVNYNFKVAVRYVNVVDAV